jgi:phosphoribosylanthranilate isomerase
MHLRVKICGVTTLEDALAACRAGADAIGLNFTARSPRRVDLDRAAAIAHALPPFVAAVGVFADAPREEIERAVRVARLQWVQLHGDEPSSALEDLPVPALKAIRIDGAASLAVLGRYPRASAFLLDGGSGGEGRAFDWSLAAEARARAGKPVIIAGGLTPDNVAAAVYAARPWGVDVASGVELSPGVKDPARVQLFIRRAREAALDL